ncbi:MAG: DUF1566 domain-containing protein [Candidatus Brocadiaceae bacterium]|nr:DUF1566 domain-containing protein [Candidatus Brocadiaceae bacterium]
MKVKLLNQITLVVPFLLLFTILASKVTFAQLYHHQYAVVIGIDEYSGAHWRDQNLNYARGDAEAIEKMLKEHGFIVYSLYDNKATKVQITSILEDQLAPILQKDDAILFFFAGHGATRELGGKDWGYLVPSDATDQSSSYISMEELRTLSRKMGNAKHQAFIMDCCYGGQLGTRASGVSTYVPNYLNVVGRRIARQILTAGGKNQEVADSGPGGHSIFTGYLLKAIEKGLADANFDGWITFSELVAFLVPAASSSIQTPGFATLPGHEQGEFLFKSDKTYVAQTDTNNNFSESLGQRSDANKVPEKFVEKNDRNGVEAKEVEASVVPITKFRSYPRERLSIPSVKAMLKKYNFPCTCFYATQAYCNPDGSGFDNKFEKKNNGQVVHDYASGLMWQQSGSTKEITYKTAKTYVAKLNSDQFAGYNDWRLPSIEEAMTLVEPYRKNGDTYIDSVFDKTQSWIWTSDLNNASFAWVVLFNDAWCYGYAIDYDPAHIYVRAVR